VKTPSALDAISEARGSAHASGVDVVVWATYDKRDGWTFFVNEDAPRNATPWLIERAGQ
jgi:hypothetical protein